MNRVLIATLLLVAPVALLNAADFKTYKDVYDKNMEEILLSRAPQDMELKQEYGKALDTLKAKVQGEGDLEKTKAVMAEIEKFQKDKNVPSVPSESALPEIKKLQTASAKQMADFEMDKARKVITLVTQYDAALDRLQKDFTKAGKIDEATAVQEERNKVKSSDYFVAAGRIIASVQPRENLAAGPVDLKKDVPTVALSKALTLDLGKNTKMKQVLIPAGKFMMGASSSEDGRQMSEVPQHEVTISKPFYMGVYEVRQEEYEAVMGSNPSKYKGRNFPVEYVTWDDAVEFCKKLSAKTKKSVRLPTEAEWEYACRAGTTTRFSFGDKDEDVRKYANYKDKSFTPDFFNPRSDAPSDGHDRDAPVGSYKSNSWGLYDMHGNVAEWCSDWLDANYYSRSSAVDPQGPTSGFAKVQRGGALLDDPKNIRSARRHGNNPTKPAFMDAMPYSFGFRVVVDVAGE